MTRFKTEEYRKKELLDLLVKHNVSTSVFPYEWLCSTDFFRAPASTAFHAAYPGGLYDHSMNVTKVLLDMDEKWVTKPWSRLESPIIVGMLHDATKIFRYQLSQDMDPITNEVATMYTIHPDYQELSIIHGEDSVLKVSQHMNLTPEESACIRWHMGAYEFENWAGYDKAIKSYPNVLWTHTADMVASKLMED